MIPSALRLGLVAVLALGGAAVAANANSGAASAAPLACGVSKVSENGMLSIEGIVQSPTALVGEYRFALRSSGAGGSTNVSQGGPFSAQPGATISLGRVSVKAGSNVDIDFTVNAAGQQFDCSQPTVSHT